jgi:hypothetical protein
VKVGNAWLLLEAGQAPLVTERALTWLKANADAAPTHAILGDVFARNGGLAQLVRTRIPVVIAPGFEPMADAVLAGHETQRAGIAVAGKGAWLRAGGDSVWIEPIDLPDARGTLLVWVPSLRWLYAPGVSTPLDRGLVLDRARQAGWAVDRLGNLQKLVQPVTARPAQ